MTETPAHHLPSGGYVNVPPEPPPSLGGLLRWWFQNRLSPPRRPDEEPLHRRSVVPAVPRFDNGSGTSLTWLGHATTLVQIDELRLLTDPVLGDSASPSRLFGPKRVVPPPLSVDELPWIDVVLVSHNHYDHLDEDSVLALHAKHGEQLLFVVPLGLKTWFTERGVSRIVELDWWESVGVGESEVVLVPARHWSARGALDQNATLWGGYVVRDRVGRSRFYYAGDTAYSPLFDDIGRRFGPIELAAIPIGAYEPRWYLANQHVNPEEALRIHEDVRAEHSVAVHWGTFDLTDEPLDAPVHDLDAAKRRLRVLPDAFVTLPHGGTWESGDPPSARAGRP